MKHFASFKHSNSLCAQPAAHGMLIHMVYRLDGPADVTCLHRALRWPETRPAAPDHVDDIYDSVLWDLFKEDAVVNTNSNPATQHLRTVPLALAFCGDGVEAYRGKHKKAHTVFCLASCILNLPPWVRTQMRACLLSTCLHGPGEPKDPQVYFDILTDELVYLHEIGVVAYDASR